MILQSLFDEEESEVALRYANSIINLYGPRIKSGDKFIQFANKQMDMVKYSAYKYQLTSPQIESDKYTNSILQDKETQELINRFIYMRDNGIFNKMFNFNK